MTWPKPFTQLSPDPRPLSPAELRAVEDHLELAWEDNPAVRVLWRRLQMEQTKVWRQILASPESTARLNNLLGQLQALELVLGLPAELLDEARSLADPSAQSSGE